MHDEPSYISERERIGGLYREVVVPLRKAFTVDGKEFGSTVCTIFLATINLERFQKPPPTFLTISKSEFKCCLLFFFCRVLSPLFFFFLPSAVSSFPPPSSCSSFRLVLHDVYSKESVPRTGYYHREDSRCFLFLLQHCWTIRRKNRQPRSSIGPIRRKLEQKGNLGGVYSRHTSSTADSH